MAGLFFAEILGGFVAKVVLFNKPFNVLSQFRDAEGRTTLSAFIEEPTLRIAGRLDRDSEGLMILTDSGRLVHKITEPAKQMSKTYWAQVEGAPAEKNLASLREGVELNDGVCKPAQVAVIDPPANMWPRDPPIRARKSVPDTWVQITISEGRNRQVRRMCAAIGFPVLRLVRYRVGSWTIDGLAPGEVLTLT